MRKKLIKTTILTPHLYHSLQYIFNININIYMYMFWNHITIIYHFVLSIYHTFFVMFCNMGTKLLKCCFCGFPKSVTPHSFIQICGKSIRRYTFHGFKLLFGFHLVLLDSLCMYNGFWIHKIKGVVNCSMVQL